MEDCDFCHDKPVFQATGVNGELKEVLCPKCHSEVSIPVLRKKDDFELLFNT
jgi:hypothetical protein